VKNEFSCIDGVDRRIAAVNGMSDIISFGNTAERLLEVMLVVLVGIYLGTY
jgi:hypothetical protein